MKLEELGQSYSYYSMTRYHRDFTKPSMDRLYAKILLEVSHHKFCPSATLRHLFSTYTSYPQVMYHAGLLAHWREGRKTYWSITEAGLKLLAKAKRKSYLMKKKAGIKS